jgi:hypothetical protein
VYAQAAKLMTKLALLVLGICLTTGCESRRDDVSAPTMPAPIAPLDTTALSRHSLGASSLAELRLLATPFGRDVLAQVVSCALPRGTALTTINRDGTPYSFPGEHGLAPAWAQRPATPSEHADVAQCLRDHGLFSIQT